MAKGFDPAILTKAALAAAQDVFNRIAKTPPSDPPTTKSQNIIEYQGRMSISAMEKFNGPTYIAGVSFYLTPQDKDKHKAVGAIAVYVEALSAEKLLKTFGFTIGEDEEEEEALSACGKLCGILAEALIKELKKVGCPDLIAGTPASEKNSLADGIESGSSSEKHEIGFFFWKKRVLVLDVVLSSIATAR
jgi:hypothetical protein